MRHEKIFKRENGTQYKISVGLIVDFRSTEFNADLETRDKGKRKWFKTSNDYKDSNEFRVLDWPEKLKYHQKKFLDHVTAEEILSVKLELWEKIKPT